jgi:hypothetical protein
MAPSGNGPGHGPTGSVKAMGNDIGHAMRYSMGGAAQENHGFAHSECSTAVHGAGPAAWRL